MYCPKCGQQQPSGNVHFCSRCGFRLDSVSELLACASLVTPEATTQSRSQSLSPRKKGVRQGAKLLFTSVVLLPIFFALAIFINGPAPLMVPLTIFLAGLTRMLYSRLFGEDGTPGYKQPLTPRQSAPPRSFGLPPSLPPSQSVRVADSITKRADTAEMMPRGSVTENTTKLIDKASDSR